MNRQGVGISIVLAAGLTLIGLLAAVLVLEFRSAPDQEQSVIPLGSQGRPTDRTATLPDPLIGSNAHATRPERVSMPGPRRGPPVVLGRLEDAATGAPIQDFQVHILPVAEEDPLERLAEHPARPFHHREGIFRVQQEEGAYDVVAVAPGFEPTVVREWAVPPVDAIPRRIRLQRGPGIQGTVYDMDGVVLPGVSVFLHIEQLYDPQTKPPIRRMVVSQHDGQYSFSPLPPGEYSLSLLEPTNPIDRLVGLRVSAGTTVQNLFLRPRHQLIVFVHRLDGGSGQGARVSARRPGGLRHATSNPGGRALLEHLLDGEYELSVALEGYVTTTEALRLDTGAGSHVRHVYLEPEEAP